MMNIARVQSGSESTGAGINSKNQHNQLRKLPENKIKTNQPNKQTAPLITFKSKGDLTSIVKTIVMA